MAISGQPSLDAVTVDSADPAIGPTESLGAVFSKHTGRFIVEGFTGTGTVNLFLDGSLDGSDWFTIATQSATSNGHISISPTGVVLALYTRARATATSASATVTAVIVSAV